MSKLLALAAGSPADGTTRTRNCSDTRAGAVTSKALLPAAFGTDSAPGNAVQLAPSSVEYCRLALLPGSPELNQRIVSG